MKVRFAKVSILVLMVLALVACATFSQNAYRSLALSYQTYDTSLSILGDLYKAGKLTEAQKARAIAIGTEYRDTHNKAVAALLLYETSDQSTAEANKAAYTRLAADSALILSRLVAYVSTFTGGK